MTQEEYLAWEQARHTAEREILTALSEKELLAELILELRQNREELLELQELGSDMYLLQKELAWDRQNSW